MGIGQAGAPSASIGYFIRSHRGYAETGAAKGYAMKKNVLNETPSGWAETAHPPIYITLWT
jgi:hypothetical protein